MEWWQTVGSIAGPLFGFAGVAYAAYLGFRGKRGETKVAASTADNSVIASRWDDASELAQYIRNEVAQEVERQVKPMRDKLAAVEKESHELQDAFREWVVGVWKWNQRGRLGDIPMPPVPILSRLGLGHFADDWPTQPTKRTHL
ncbi:MULTISPECIES: hypothetical protein [unclassified Microbacterium]|uniref:hypothetical protein n=1 Tax=unclassified Microbacterium TaxID=2609290 RepID=UPI003863E216